MPDDLQDPAAPPAEPDALPPPAEEADEDALLEAHAQVDQQTGQKMINVPLSTLVGLRKTNRDLKGKLRETEPQLQRAAEIEQRLTAVQPVISAVLTDPNLRAQATRVANGTRQSRETTAQPQDDPDAVAFAESMGMYMNDNMTPDAARAQRVLAALDKRTFRQTEAAVRPFANIAVGSRAETNLHAALAMTDSHGQPMASAESIREVAAALTPDMLANPEVIDKVLINTAIGLDKRKGRVPRATTTEEPIFLENASRGNGRREISITPAERDRLARVGITEKEYAEAGRKLQQNPRGIAME